MNWLREFTLRLRAALGGFTDDGGRALSAALVYYSTLSTVPLLLITVSLPGLALRFINRRAGEQLIERFSTLFGGALSEMIENYLAGIQQSSLIAVMIGLLMLLYSASSGFRFLRYAFRRIWREEETQATQAGWARLRKTVLERTIDYLVAFGLVLSAGLVALAGLLIFAIASFARALLRGLPFFDSALGWLVAPLSLLAIYVLIYLLLLKIMPPIRVRWRDIWLPALACGTAVLVTTYGLGIYIRFFSARSIYGAIGTIFALQIWTYANSMALFFCVELCRVFVRERSERD